MPSEPSDHNRRPPTTKTSVSAPPPEPEHLPCPRCDSTNTKFCYYNNYNFSQPRHFCKSCRRYWTHGGTLRDIPIGGGTRKSSKRSRLSVTTTTTTTHTHNMAPSAATPMLFPFAGEYERGFQFLGDRKPGGCESFTSLLNGNQLFGYEDGGYGYGYGYGNGFGLGLFSGVGDGNTWQVESGGESFGLPDLAISTRGMM